MAGLLDNLLWRLPRTVDQQFPAPFQATPLPRARPDIPPEMILPAGMQQAPLALPGRGFPSPYDEANPAAVAEEARQAAALRMRKSTLRPGAFGSGAAPVPFGGMLSAEGVLGAPGGTPEPQQPADLPPSTNDPQSGEPDVLRDGVPLPRPKPIDATAGGQPIRAPMSLAPPTEEDLSARARPTATGTPTIAPTPSAGNRFLSGLSNALNNNSSTLLALGAGFAGAPSFGTGMSRAFAAAGPAAALDRANTMKQGGIQATYTALVSRGVPPAEALAAVYNPDVMKATAAKYFETKSPININGVLVKEQPDGTMKVVGDFSDTSRKGPEIKEFKGPGDTVSYKQWNAKAGQWIDIPGVEAGGGGAKVPAGYEWVDTKDPSKGLRAIPGGPGTKLPAETAGRIAMMETAANALPAAREILMRDRGSMGTGVGGIAASKTNIGDVGRAQRTVRTAIEGALRAMTGAAAPVSEVERYEGMFMPSPLDSPETASQKLDQLEDFINNARRLVTQGHSSLPPGTVAPIAPSTRTMPAPANAPTPKLKPGETTTINGVTIRRLN